MKATLAIQRLKQKADKNRAKISQKFFKTGKGEYGNGDIFIGVSVPDIRLISREFQDLGLSEIKKLLSSMVHEERLVALFILVEKFEASNKKRLVIARNADSYRGGAAISGIASQKDARNDKEKVYKFYLRNLKYVNNWDLVDSSAYKILGTHLSGKKDRKILYRLARSKNIWERRIAIVATYHFIKNNQFTDAIAISEILLSDSHDLIHKAVGWMLRETGKRQLQTLEKFLKKYAKVMPRTMLRYAIEKFPEVVRRSYLQKP